MKYKFYSIRINVTKYDITFATKEGFNPKTSPWLRHCVQFSFREQSQVQEYMQLLNI